MGLDWIRVWYMTLWGKIVKNHGVSSCSNENYHVAGVIPCFQTHPMWTPDGSKEVLGISEGIVGDANLVSPSLSARKAISQPAIFDSQDRTLKKCIVV